jgi:bifunctional UDP-N-acetylglucosamine pyrophosphorylase/glucosamine-1-phosphate N-acetyltransferase
MIIAVMDRTWRLLMKSIGIVVLAAGKGTRLKISTPKPLLKCLGKSLINYVLDEAQLFYEMQKLEPKISIITGHEKELVTEHLKKNYSLLEYLWQKEQRGTGDALKTYIEETSHQCEFTFIVCADTPLITHEIYERIYQHLKMNPDLDGIAVTFDLKDPTGYGRIIHNEKGFIIKEEKDASTLEKKIIEVNAGFYLVRNSYLMNQVPKLNTLNNSKEFYLTDIFKDNKKITAMKFEDSQTFLGINSLDQLADASHLLKIKKNTQLMKSGVTLLDSHSTYVDWDVVVDPGTTLFPYTTILGKTHIHQNVLIESGVFIKDSEIFSEAQILASSHLEGAMVRTGAHIGPFARLRPLSDIGAKSKIGNFVEIKKSTLSSGVKISHLSYVGDATIGEETNIGCGFITCNYDGMKKHQTQIGKKTFIGSDCHVIAPISIGDESFVAAGSTITKDVPNGAFAIARTPQTNKENFAVKFLPKKTT